MKANPVAEALIQAQQRLMDKGLWTVGVVYGQQTLAPEVRKYCAVHTVSMCTSASRETVHDAIRLMNKVACEHFGRTWPSFRTTDDAYDMGGHIVPAAEVNDLLGYEATMEMFRLAIEEALKEGQDGRLDDSRQGTRHSGVGNAVLLDVASGAVVAQEASKGWKHWIGGLTRKKEQSKCLVQ